MTIYLTVASYKMKMPMAIFNAIRGFEHKIDSKSLSYSTDYMREIL